MMRLALFTFLSLFLCFSHNSNSPVEAALDERERVQEYHNRNYTWPLEEVVPNTPGWRKIMFRRLAQVPHVENRRDRYNGWLSTMGAALTVPNFTENGWGLTRAPTELVEELKASLHNGLATAKTENFINVIEGSEEERPLFITQQKLNDKVLKELQPMHEKWSGQKLRGAIAYGLRAYRNNSVLNMHADRVATHVISCILHVDHSDDSEPWPIFIEDYQGNTNEVVLESGDMLFYESAKCVHGRPRKFNGSWYSSIFVHYYPRGWNAQSREMEAHYAIPPHWHESPPADPDLDDLIVVGTSMKEPNCPDQWCGTQNTVKWFGPAKEGVVISTGYKDEAQQEKQHEKPESQHTSEEL